MENEIFFGPGIYRITNTITGEFYIGRSCHMYERLKQHFSRLRCGCHSSGMMQDRHDRYGLESFKVDCLESIEVDDQEDGTALLLSRESFFIAQLRPQFNGRIGGPKKPNRTEPKGTYIPKELYDELAKYAAEMDRSVSYLVKKAVEQHLERLRSERGK